MKLYSTFTAYSILRKVLLSARAAGCNKIFLITPNQMYCIKIDQQYVRPDEEDDEDGEEYEEADEAEGGEGPYRQNEEVRDRYVFNFFN
ncbi:hypothetical protein KGF57_002272 [Candida theae]|uniref:Uncharacterized protein n=1 Tax=Candida theae TaxID=1198502 RepID=A0AAD5FZ39_9ASCO|nr:uncharacterized protein KGF57_002272 [Candida theae]KAI5958838.1 hypothetical protein KGF57_002272 [Candida theae]